MTASSVGTENDIDWLPIELRSPNRKFPRRGRVGARTRAFDRLMRRSASLSPGEPRRSGTDQDTIECRFIRLTADR